MTVKYSDFQVRKVPFNIRFIPLRDIKVVTLETIIVRLTMIDAR